MAEPLNPFQLVPETHKSSAELTQLLAEDFHLERHCQVMSVLNSGPLTAERVVDAAVLAIEDDVAIGLCLAVVQDEETTFRCQVQFSPHSTELVGNPRWIRN